MGLLVIVTSAAIVQRGDLALLRCLEGYCSHWLKPLRQAESVHAHSPRQPAARRRISLPRDRYGLDAVVCWPRLWLLLPDSTRKELQEARAALNIAVRICLWSLLFLIWTPLAWWAPLFALPAVWLSYRLALNTASAYVDLLEAAFDVHRHLLYQSLRVKLPKNPTEEAQDGKKLTQYLWREPERSMPDFYDPPAK